MPRCCGDMVAVVLAGGLGTRVRHLLPDVPKPMAPVAGRPFLEHIVRFLGAQGLARVVLSTGHLSSVIEAHFAGHPVEGIEISCVREDTPLGTAGGFVQAARSLAARPAVWLVVNGDSLTVTDLAAFRAEFEAGHWSAALLGVGVSDAARFGTLEVRADGRLRRFLEKRSGAGLINAGIYLVRDTLVDQFPEKSPLSFETEVFPRLLDEGARIMVHAVEAPFLDIGSPESLALSDDFIRRTMGQQSEPEQRVR